MTAFVQLLEDLGRDLGRGVHLPAHGDAGVAVRGLDHLVRDHLLLFGDLGVLPAHEALDGEDGVLRVGHRLALGDLADEALRARVLAERDDGRGRPPAFGVGDHLRLAAFEHGHDRVGRSEVNPDHLAHRYLAS